MKRKFILYTTTVLLTMIGGQQGWAQTQGKKQQKSFSPKMLVYENLKNENVLRHFNQRFAQLDTLINNPIWVKSPVIELGLNKQHTADIKTTDSLYWAKTAYEQLAINRHNGLEVTGQIYARPDAYFDADNDDAEQVSKYKAKVQAELGWNIINSKFYQGKEKRNKVALANELSRLQDKKRQTADIYEKAADELTEQYNFYIGTVIAHKLDNLDIMNEAYQYMLEKDRISNDKFSHNGDVGIRFTVPIYNENPRKRKALETQKEIIMNSRSTDVKEIRQSVKILLKKIENLNQAIATEAYHIQQTGKYIDMRRFAYKNQKNGYNYLMRMEEYTGLLESMERMYKLMLNRGLAIINIEKAVSIYNNNNIFNEIEL